MTDVLRETLEERGRARPWKDVEGLLAAGDRRVRRRRVTGAAAAVAAVAALAVATPYVVDAVGPDDAQVAVEASFDTTQPSWLDGSVLHVGGDTVALGSNPEAYVLTDDAAVVAAADGTVELHGGDGSTEIGTIGRFGAPGLVASGSRVAWFDADDLSVVVYDTAAREEVLRQVVTASEAMPLPAVEALDGDDLWWTGPGFTHGIDVTTGEQFRRIVFDSSDLSFVDAAGGRHLRTA